MDDIRFNMIMKMIDFDELTDWEEKFVIDIEHKVKSGRKLTEYQEDKLEEIWRKQ